MPPVFVIANYKVHAYVYGFVFLIFALNRYSEYLVIANFSS